MVGCFLVLPAQVFTGDALSHVAFTGAMAALAFGYDLRLGLFAATIAMALLFGALGRRARPDDVVIGSVFSWILGMGAFFITLYTTSRSATNGTVGISVLFGSIFGISAGSAVVAAAVAAGVGLLVVLIARPLLFATLDEAVAAARGIPVRLLSYGFLALAGICAVEATQAVGCLLLLGLLAAPEEPRSGSPTGPSGRSPCPPGWRCWRSGRVCSPPTRCRRCRPASPSRPSPPPSTPQRS
ncbi:metal ABC transporter permease [Streptomyces sp. NPDC086989]|uniref:metal ABC transporter permease n=1 Tax=Streptomyces sp. NPDC086989 TaxID=3365764 RepID=UPI00380AAB2B